MHIAPSPVHVRDAGPVAVRAWAADAEGRQTGEARLSVDGPARLEDDGLVCDRSGEATVTARYEALEATAVVDCDLVKRVRMEDRAVLRPGEAVDLSPVLLGHDEQPVQHEWTSSTTPPGVLDERLVALSEGTTVLTVTAGKAQATMQVWVGTPVLEETLRLGLEEGQQFDLPEGRYLALTDSEQMAGVAFTTGDPSCRDNGDQVHLECTLAEPGPVRVQNLTDNSGWQGRFRVLSLD